MSLEDIQVVDVGISSWGIMADNHIVGKQDTLQPGNQPEVPNVDGQASSLGSRGSALRRDKKIKNLAGKRWRLSAVTIGRKEGFFSK